MEVITAEEEKKKKRVRHRDGDWDVAITELRLSQEDRQEIGQRIEEERQRQGMTQNDLAVITGRGRTTVERFLAGTQSMGIEDLIAIARAQHRGLSYYLQGIAVWEDSAKGDKA